MKKIRVMLVAIAVFALSGGALALKAKKFGSSSCCMTTTAGGDLCCISLTNASFNVIGATAYKYVITNNPQCCTLWPRCTSIGRVND